MESLSLEGKVALVTGAAKGIGKVIVEKLVTQGSTVYVNSKSSRNIDEWCREFSEKSKGSALPLYFDVTDEKGCKSAILSIRKEQGGLDILINNAGIVSYEMLGMVKLSDFRQMLEVNVVGPLNLIQLASRVMGRRATPSIINISSAVAVQGVEGQVAYSSSKGALISMTRSAAKELAPKGIRVNAIAPGMVATDRLQDASQKGFSEKVNDIRMGEMVHPEEVADLCVYLSSNISKSVTGQVISIDGALKL